MTRYIILFLMVLLWTNTSKANTNLTVFTPTDSIVVDSAYISQVNMLIRDYKVLTEYCKDTEDRLRTARELLNRVVQERNEYKRLYEEVDNALKEMAERKAKLERKLKRTRRIGIFGSIGGFIAGVLVVIFI